MNRIILLSSLFFLALSCKEEVKTEPIVEINRIPAEIPPVDDFDYDTLRGMYIGDFGGSDIRIILNYVSGSNAIGYNIHKGLTRNISGKVERKGESILLKLAEPGDHEYDGVFELVFEGIDKEPSGTWNSNSGEISGKSFSLKKLEQAKTEGDEITSYNFSRYFGFLSDTLGNYHFDKDGLCRYEYYPKDEEGKDADQMIEVAGSWSLTDSIVVIEWQPNERFTKNRMVFITKEHEYGERYLKGEGMELYGYWY